MITVDTGSTDKTKEIAITYEAKVLDFYGSMTSALRSMAAAHPGLRTHPSNNSLSIQTGREISLSEVLAAEEN